MPPSIYGGLYMSNEYKVDYPSPIGILEITGSKEGVISIMFSDRTTPNFELNRELPKSLRDCYVELEEYFKGKRKNFTFPILMEGTNFQKTVWTALSTIHYAEVKSYKDIAQLIGNEKAIRAVGNANGKNKLSIVIPCHRVIGTNGKLTGYAGGLWRKEWLLEHEKKRGK